MTASKTSTPPGRSAFATRSSSPATAARPLVASRSYVTHSPIDVTAAQGGSSTSYSEPWTNSACGGGGGRSRACPRSCRRRGRRSRPRAAPPLATPLPHLRSTTSPPSTPAARAAARAGPAPPHGRSRRSRCRGHARDARPPYGLIARNVPCRSLASTPEIAGLRREAQGWMTTFAALERERGHRQVARPGLVEDR